MDFIILKVNGQDLSNASHEVAVEAFRAAREPIVVEVLRRTNPALPQASKQSPGSTSSGSNSGKSTPSSTHGSGKMKSKTLAPVSVSVSTQTDDLIENQQYYGLDRPPTPPPCYYNFSTGLFQPSSRQPVAFSPTDDMGGLTDIEMANCVRGYDDEEIMFEDESERNYDVEYEEVTLYRTSSQEKIGLTLCYGAGDDDVTDVFISEVYADSIAGADGRIREGDQILQINYQDVCSRDQAIKLFSQSLPDITLLLARPAQLQIDDGFMDGRPCVLDNLHVEMLEQHHHIIPYPCNLLHQHLLDEEGATTDTATTENSLHKHEKDSGVGRTDDSTKNDESSEHEIDSVSCPIEHIYSNIEPQSSIDQHYISNDSFTCTEPGDLMANEISQEDCEKFREVLQSRCAGQKDEAVSCLNNGDSPTKPLTKQDSQSSIEKEIAILNKEMEHIQMECEEIVELHLRDQKLRTDIVRNDSPIVRSPRMVPRMGTRYPMKVPNSSQLMFDGHFLGTTADGHVIVPDLSVPAAAVAGTVAGSSGGGGGSRVAAAGGTAAAVSDTATSRAASGACRSAAFTLELEENGNDRHGSILCLAAQEQPSQCTSDSEKSTQTTAPTNKQMPAQTFRGDNSRRGSGDKESRRPNQPLHSLHPHPTLNHDVYERYANVMYTNKANLEHTITVQQQLFHQQMMRRKGGAAFLGETVQNRPPVPPRPLANNTQRLNNRVNLNDKPVAVTTVVDQQQLLPEMEWVVKRRADGSRYITRRPVRNKLLKERAKKVAEERCGMTTDDDAVSEMKTGRYWSREDRKKHLEKARDYKRRKEIMLRARTDNSKEPKPHDNVSVVKAHGSPSLEAELRHGNMAESSLRKAARSKSRKAPFDESGAKQEMPAHSVAKAPGITDNKSNQLLAVTTV